MKRLGNKESNSNSSSGSSGDESDSSDDGVNIKSLRQKMSKKKKKRCKRRMEERLKQAGTSFPVDDFETTSSSGNESCKSSTHRNKGSKVKSGAKIRKRPVVRTEMWPHIVANEDDGEDVTSENIPLAKFFSCYTYIMSGCGGVESQGRSSLLHAVSLVLEYLQWIDARVFHNMVMTKIEQDRLNWGSDFVAIEEAFIDKKVRLGLRSKFTSSGASSYKSSYYGKSVGKGFKGQYQKSSKDKGKPIFGAICWQWNVGTCSYGDACKRWHVCKVCAEEGKLGEKHKSSTHESGGGSGSRYKPRV